MKTLVLIIDTEQCVCARLTFVREHQNWQVRHWHPILFANKGRFTLST